MSFNLVVRVIVLILGSTIFLKGISLKDSCFDLHSIKKGKNTQYIFCEKLFQILVGLFIISIGLKYENFIYIFKVWIVICIIYTLIYIFLFSKKI